MLPPAGRAAGGDATLTLSKGGSIMSDSTRKARSRKAADRPKKPYAGKSLTWPVMTLLHSALTWRSNTAPSGSAREIREKSPELPYTMHCQGAVDQVAAACCCPDVICGQVGLAGSRLFGPDQGGGVAGRCFDLPFCGRFCGLFHVRCWLYRWRFNGRRIGLGLLDWHLLGRCCLGPGRRGFLSGQRHLFTSAIDLASTSAGGLLRHDPGRRYLATRPGSRQGNTTLADLIRRIIVQYVVAIVIQIG